MTQQQENIALVQKLVAEYQAGRPEGYLAGVSDTFKGSVLGGLIPGAHDIKSKDDFIAVMQVMPEFMEVSKFDPSNWRAVGDDVLFNVSWEFLWKPTGKTHATTALVRKVVKGGLICEKYHMIDCEPINGIKSPHDTSALTRVKELLAEYQAGNPEGYLAGCAETFKGSVLGGLIPGAEDIQSKAGFAKLMNQMSEYMEVQKFEPHTFLALPNDDMMFNVDWKFVYKPTGKTVETTAIVRKVVKDNQICEKYHLLDASVIQESPRSVIASED